MHRWSLMFVVGCSTGSLDPTTDSPRPTPTDLPGPTDTGTYTPPAGPAPCDPLEGMSVDEVTVEQPWTEHEAEFTIQLSAPAAVAVACQLDGDPSEVHLVEGVDEEQSHSLRMAGLLAESTYQCSIAPVCPSSTDEPTVVELQTRAQSNPLLPTLVPIENDPAASPDYVLTNHQIIHPSDWFGQRRLVFDKDAAIRWHAAPDAGGDAGGNVVNWSRESGTFTIGGGWPPNRKGRPQQIELFGSDVRYDSRPWLPNGDAAIYHHEARELSDGRLMSFEEVPVTRTEGGTFEGFAVHIVDPETNQVEFAYSSQRAYDDGHLSGGGGDAYHANWADVVGGVLNVSLCFTPAIVGIDVPSGDWRWFFGPNGDFDLVDANGQDLPNSEYPQCQHGLQRRGARLLVYDNGNSRGFSRAVEYELNESTMTATKLWDWTEPEWFERALGGVDYTSNGGVLIAMGHISSQTPTPGDRSTFVEIDPVSGDKLWEVQYQEETDMAYRADSLGPCEIFANARFCGGIADRIRDLEPVLSVVMP